MCSQLFQNSTKEYLYTVYLLFNENFQVEKIVYWLGYNFNNLRRKHHDEWGHLTASSIWTH